MKELDELHLIDLISFLLIALVLALPTSPIRIALGVPFVLLFPGYTLIATLYPRRDDLDGMLRLVLSLGLSLAIVPLIGLMQNFSPWGIRLNPILISLTGFILACSLLAERARRRFPRTERFSIEIVPLVAQARRLSWFQITVAAAVTASIAFVVWRLPTGSSPTSEPFTEFYVLGASGKAGGYPDLVTVGKPAEVILGVINHELHPTTYKITIWAGNQVLAALGPISLNAGQKWQRSVKFSPKRLGTREKIDLFLFKGDNPTPYRHLHLWMQVISP